MTETPIPLPSKLLCRADMDPRTRACGAPDCPGRAILIRQKCHPEAGLRANYAAARGELVLTCAACGGPAARIQVAWAVPS